MVLTLNIAVRLMIVSRALGWEANEISKVPISSAWNIFLELKVQMRFYLRTNPSYIESMLGFNFFVCVLVLCCNFSLFFHLMKSKEFYFLMGKSSVAVFYYTSQLPIRACAKHDFLLKALLLLYATKFIFSPDFYVLIFYIW